MARTDVMDNLKELNNLILEEIDRLMDTKDERELALLDVLTDACMELEDFLYQEKPVTH